MVTECSHPKRVKYSHTPDVETPFKTEWWCPECDTTSEAEKN